MEPQALSDIPSSRHSIWIWIILVGLLLVAVLIAVGSLAYLNSVQQSQAPAETQAAPAP